MKKNNSCYNAEMDDVVKKFLIDVKIEEFICIDSHLGTGMTRSMKIHA